MDAVPVTGAIAEYRNNRVPIVFSGDDWVALRCSAEDAPDGFEFGDYSVGLGFRAPWAKVPRSALVGILHLRVSATVKGHTVSLRHQLPDGRIAVEFVGPPAVAKELGLDGDQYMGWTGLFAPEDLDDIHVEETRRG